VGSTNQSLIAGKIYDHSDDSASPIADFVPWRSTPLDPHNPEIRVDPVDLAIQLFPGSQGNLSLEIHNDGSAEMLTFSIQEGAGMLKGGDSGSGRMREAFLLKFLAVGGANLRQHHPRWEHDDQRGVFV